MIWLAVNMIFQALDILLDLNASMNEQSRNDRHPDFRVDSTNDMRFFVDHNDNVSGDIEICVLLVSNSPV